MNTINNAINHVDCRFTDPDEFEPKEGSYLKTIEFLRHIFGEQLEIGLDYLSIIYFMPTEKLPILCLVSKEKKTGKSTFLSWLKFIFGANMTINTDEDFRNNFNTDWLNKHIIAGDGFNLKLCQSFESVVTLCQTITDIYTIDIHNGAEIQHPLIVKFILCSNQENDFIKIDPDKNSFWVRKISSISNEIPDLLSDLIEEWPAFLFFLQHREIKSPKKTRLWFTRDQLNNETDQVNETNVLLFDNEERIPDEMLKRFVEFQFKEWIQQRIKVGKSLKWRNEDVLDAVLMGLHIEPTTENKNIIQQLAEK